LAAQGIREQPGSGAVIITGASRGIGAATALLAAERGFAVAVNYATGKNEAAEVVSKIQASGGKATAIHANLGREDDIVRLFAEAERLLGPLRGLVNNAGVTGGFARVEDVTAAMLERLLAVNVAGAILCAREAVKLMSTKHGGSGGAIVNISSLAARTGSPGEWVHYAATKGAIDTFTIGLAREVAKEGIRVNGVAPGLVETGIHAANGEPGRLDRLKPTIPLGRPGKPEEIAEAVVWLLSSASSYVTGSILEVGGGR
jgi:NAD(P)-dependent dehydrogenase (short-subunit alcohol dehydrogenase family)